MSAVRHRPEAQRFEVDLPGGPAVLTYQRRGDEAVLEHTVVPVAHRGNGTGAALTVAALRWAAAEHLAVVPQCSYVAAWLHEHPGEIAVEVR